MEIEETKVKTSDMIKPDDVKKTPPTQGFMGNNMPQQQNAAPLVNKSNMKPVVP